MREWVKLPLPFILALPYIFYLFILMKTTPGAVVIDPSAVAVSFLQIIPSFILSYPAFLFLVKARGDLLWWVLTIILGIFIPPAYTMKAFNFLMMPASLIGGQFLSRNKWASVISLFLLSTPIAYVLISDYYGAIGKNRIPLQQIDSFRWLDQNTKPMSLILTHPYYAGPFNPIPVFTHNFVIATDPAFYKSKFGTLEERKKDIQDAYCGDVDVLKKYNIKFAYYGDEEKKLSCTDKRIGDLVFENEGVKVSNVMTD